MVDRLRRDALAKDAGVAADASGFTGVVLNLIVSATEEVDEALAVARCCGGTIIKPGQQARWGGYFGHFADPDGNIWEVAMASD